MSGARGYGDGGMTGRLRGRVKFDGWKMWLLNQQEGLEGLVNIDGVWYS